MIGGSFDPIHVGHLSVAREVHERLGLDQMVFVPAGQPPHKLDKRLADAGHRLAMVRLAIAGDPDLTVSQVDVDRPGPCYSVDTVRLLRDRLQSAWGAEIEIYFTIGADSLIELPTWYQPRELLRLCTVVAVGRPGYDANLRELERLLPGAPPILYLALHTPVDVSSTDIRQRVAEGRSIHGLVPEAVERYIHAHGLYRDGPLGRGASSSPPSSSPRLPGGTEGGPWENQS
jgi:nicotinate-nucleotide adenylyltransferase